MMQSKRFFNLIAMMNTFCSPFLEEDKHNNRFEFEPVRMKGSAGVYNKNKHMSRKQRMQKKNKKKGGKQN